VLAGRSPCWTVRLEQFVELGIEFALARDDLDSLKTALFEDRYIGQLRLLRYDRSPAQGIDVQVDATARANVASPRSSASSISGGIR